MDAPGTWACAGGGDVEGGGAWYPLGRQLARPPPYAPTHLGLWAPVPSASGLGRCASGRRPLALPVGRSGNGARALAEGGCFGGTGGSYSRWVGGRAAVGGGAAGAHRLLTLRAVFKVLCRRVRASWRSWPTWTWSPLSRQTPSRRGEGRGGWVARRSAAAAMTASLACQVDGSVLCGREGGKRLSGEGIGTGGGVGSREPLYLKTPYLFMSS